MPSSHEGRPRLLKEPDSLDSFALCITAALSFWGRPVSYDCVAALAGPAFSPALDQEEPCAHRWIEAGNDLRIGFLGHALGFRARKATDVTELAMRSIDVPMRRCGKTWWIVEDAAEGGPKRWETDLTYVLRPTERSLTQGEALGAALAFAARIAAPAFRRDNCAFGGALYEAWLARARDGDLCPPCGENGWRCAARTARRARRTHQAAAAFLRRVGAFLPRARQVPLAGEAADAYERMAGLLSDYAKGPGMQQALGSATGRATYADTIARVRDLHRRAAGRLELLARAL
jgi:hypothetical protein